MFGLVVGIHFFGWPPKRHIRFEERDDSRFLFINSHSRRRVTTAVEVLVVTRKAARRSNSAGTRRRLRCDHVT